MKIFNKGMNVQAVMFACNNCGAVWAATDTWNPKTSQQTYFTWKDSQEPGAVFYSRSKSGKTFYCECPNCRKKALTPAALHNAYMNYVKELN